MTELDAEALHRLCRERAPETVDWQAVISKRCIDERHMPDELTEPLSKQVATREDVIQEIHEERNLSYSEASDVVNHAINLGLITTANSGNFVYVAVNRGGCSW